MYIRSSFKSLVLCSNKKVYQHSLCNALESLSHKKDVHNKTINFDFLRKVTQQDVSTACFLSSQERVK